MSISVQGISKSFKGRRKGEPENEVLKDVNFEVEEGQFVSLLGPSGCGKTTTLTIIAGFQKATDGVIKVNGAKVEKPGPDRRLCSRIMPCFHGLRWERILNILCGR